MNGTLAPGRHHVVHSALNALPHLPPAAIVALLLIAAAVALVAVVDRRTGTPYVHGQATEEPGDGQA